MCGIPWSSAWPSAASAPSTWRENDQQLRPGDVERARRTRQARRERRPRWHRAWWSRALASALWQRQRISGLERSPVQPPASDGNVSEAAVHAIATPATHTRTEVSMGTSAEDDTFYHPGTDGVNGRQPIKRGSSSSAPRPWRGRSRRPCSAARPALSAAMMAMPSRAGVMIACWTTADGLIEADGEIGEQPVDFLRLGGDERRGPRRLVRDGRRPGDERLDVALKVGDGLLRLPRDA